MDFVRSLLLALAASGACASALAADRSELLQALKLPPGFHIAIEVDDVPGARSLALGDRGTLFVGTQKKGSVYAVRALPDGRRQVLTIARGLNWPNGVAFREGSLYVAEISRILRYDDIESRLDKPPRPVVVAADLPRDMHHGWKYIAFGPDGKLYVPIGAPCNICDEPTHALILRMKPDGSEREVFARGVRNTVGFTWHPVTQEFWFTDNGRDYLGDDAPPCELNRAPRAGLHFGFPFCHQPTEVLGRPVDLLVMADGSVLVSDGSAGVIYRITYRAPG